MARNLTRQEARERAAALHTFDDPPAEAVAYQLTSNFPRHSLVHMVPTVVCCERTVGMLYLTLLDRACPPRTDADCQHLSTPDHYAISQSPLPVKMVLERSAGMTRAHFRATVMQAVYEEIAASYVEWFDAPLRKTARDFADRVGRQQFLQSQRKLHLCGCGAYVRMDANDGATKYSTTQWLPFRVHMPKEYVHLFERAALSNVDSQFRELTATGSL